MLERKVTIINQLGLHARAAAQLVRTARLFRSRIILTHGSTGESANAKSILSLLHIAAGIGVSIIVTADGEDEQAAMEAVEKLFADGFGEL